MPRATETTRFRVRLEPFRECDTQHYGVFDRIYKVRNADIALHKALSIYPIGVKWLATIEIWKECKDGEWHELPLPFKLSHLSKRNDCPFLFSGKIRFSSEPSGDDQ